MVGAVGQLPCFKDLIAVLFECFLIISLGYLSCRFKLITNQAKDLNSYLTTFALPMIIFLNIAQMEFHTINLSFLFCMLTAKLLVFISVTLLTTIISYPTNFGYAGSLSILATQSNDFALGYPLIKSLYGDAKPEMLNYLSLMAPIQLLILNPLGIAMLEYHKSKKPDGRSKPFPTGDCQLCKKATKPSSTDESKIQQTRANVRLNNVDLPPGTSNKLLVSNGIKKQCLKVNLKSNLSDNSENQSRVQLNDCGLRHKNVKSLVLTLPARINIIESDSEESINTLNESQAQSNLLNNDEGILRTTNQNQHQNQIRRIFDRESPLVDLSLVDGSFQTRSSSPTDLLYCSCPTKATNSAQEQKINLSFLYALATNPLIIASVVALLVNLTHGPELPKYVTRVSSTIAASFASPALFVVGLSMYGKFELLVRNPNDLLLSSVLVITKVLLLPTLMRTLALIVLPKYTPVDEIQYLIDFSFLYGLLPTAPTACIIAKQYGVLSNVVSISMLLSTFISAPLMLGSALIINPSSVINVEAIENIILQTMKVASVLTLFLTVLTLYGLWRKLDIHYTTLNNLPDSICARINKIRAKPMGVFLFLLVVSQVLVGFGGFTWYFVNTKSVEENTLGRLLSKQDQAINLTAPVEPHFPTTIPFENIDSTDQEPIESWFESVQLNFHFGLKTLFKLQYVLSSFGLIMSRFAILSMVITLAATTFLEPLRASKVAASMIKTYAIFGATSVVWLIFDSDRLKHLPVEPSLPSQPISLYLRFLYDICVVAASIPVFALTIRSDNKRRNQISEENQARNSSFAKRRFVTSSASLSSDTSSALTTNTNLELLVNQNLVAVSDLNAQQQQANCDAISIILDGGPYDARRPASPNEDRSIVNQANLFSYGSTTNGNEQTGRHYEVEESTVAKQIKSNSNQFNKYSIFIVFMLINSTLNLTSIAQKLLQDQPFGTFRQIEVINVALEFGQGLLTFLIYIGTKDSHDRLT